MKIKIVLATCLMPWLSYATCNTEPLIGSICVTAANYCPVNYVEARGQTLPISANATLYSLIGSTYGGDGVSTFGLPDLRGRSSVGSGQGRGLSNVVRGQMRGSEETILQPEHLPAHTHQVIFKGNSSDVSFNQTSVTIPVYADSGSNSTKPDSGRLTESPESGPASAAIWSDGSGKEVGDIKGSVSAMSATEVTPSGTVTVKATGGSRPFFHLPPQLGLLHCIAVQGVYPSRD